MATGRRPTCDFYPIVVVGGGPTGLTLANLLSRYGVRALLVEQNAATVQEPRAVSIDDESLRTMQAFGAVDTVMSQMAAGYGSEYYSPSGRRFLKVEPSGRPYGYPRRNAFRQPILEAQLREHIEASPGTVDVLFGWKLDRFEQDDEGVTLHLAGAGGEQRVVRCGYLAGADGASSPVRAALGLTLDGETFREKWLIVDLEDSPAESRETIVFCDIRRPCIALPGPNRTRRFEFKLLPGEAPEAMVDEAKVRSLIAAHGAAPGSRIVRKTVYTFHARLAPRWSRGRVYLAGDACHLTPPFAGQGMNSGIRDAHNLAWKLAWVVSGRAAPELLDSYEPERREHVREMINLALRMGRIMGPPTALHGRVTQAFFRSLASWPAARAYFAEMKYKPKPRFAQGFIVAEARAPRTNAVGRLLPQPEVVVVGGEKTLLDELLGPGFSLVAVTDDLAGLAQAEQAFRAAGVEVKAVAIRSCAPDKGQHPSVAEAWDPSGALAKAAQRFRGCGLIVRPDRYVFSAFALKDASRAAGRLRSALVGDPAAPAARSAMSELETQGSIPAM